MPGSFGCRHDDENSDEICICAFHPFLLVVEAKTQPGASDPKRTVDRFLNAWLVKKDFTQVRRDFSAEAFSNKLILSEDCVAYIRDKDRAFPE
jgi:hypothetical protein